MNIKERNRQNKAYVQFRMIFDIAMGLLYIACGVLVMMAKKFGIDFSVVISRTFMWSLAILLILYGLFRIFRGIKHIF
ncbi:MAG: hypothetical protein EPN39_16180 [Chitinophagaceae bacterium]|jgi:hypothetical protein|nr:MAG: hypothetical protein EPN39_16180 [Chitinophagaceae bacterium]